MQVLKRYPGIVPMSHEHFNKRQSRARMIVESLYGRLKGRFQCLMTPIRFHDLKLVCIIVVACLCLHNLLTERRIPYYPEYCEDAEYHQLMSNFHITSANSRARSGRVSNSAKDKRDCLRRFVNNAISEDECLRILHLAPTNVDLLLS